MEGDNKDPVKISRNAPCPCGSGKKYKLCCGAQIVAAEREAEEQRRAEMCGLRRLAGGQKRFKRIGRRPVMHEPIAVRIKYFDGRDEDRVRLQGLSNDRWQISGWPQVPPGEKRPRERSFELDDIETLFLAKALDDLPRLTSGEVGVKSCVAGQPIKKTTVILKGTACDGRYSWENDSPVCLRKVESLVQRLVARFHELCNSVNLADSVRE